MGRTFWHGETVETVDTTLGELPGVLPVFDRYGFGGNRYRDVIVRRTAARVDEVAVGTVSKKYVLVQHADAARAVAAEVRKAGIDPASVPTRLLISEYGTRIALRATLPERYNFTPDDGHPIALTFECFNSVDGSVPLFAAVGWFRFICSNGLILGTRTASVRAKHLPPLAVDEISEVLGGGMEAALKDARSLARWRATRIHDADLARWVDGPVATAWGPLAAARAYTIARTGFDGTPARAPRKVPPHNWPMKTTDEVPGAGAPCTDGHGVAQVLAWIASRRNDVAQRLQWRGQINDLMSHLVPPQAA